MAAKTRFIAGLALGTWLSLAPATAQSILFVVGYGGPMETITREKILPAFEEASDVKVTYAASSSTDILANLQVQRGNQETDVAVSDPMAILRPYARWVPSAGKQRLRFERKG